MVDFAVIKANARRAVHQQFAVPVSYYAPGSSTVTASLTARLHGKIVQGGDLQGGGYALIIENVTRVVFNQEEFALQVPPLTLQVRGKVFFPDYNVAVVLETMDPHDGPINERWSVAPATLPN
jgi:hypothetical protein